MSLDIVQRCNGCGVVRNIYPIESTNLNEIKEILTHSGWVEVQKNKHLCQECVKTALRKA